jgi:hypothetical protein
MAPSTSRKRRPANEKTLAPVRPNVGIEIAYQRKLEKLIDEMAASVSYFVKAAYRANEPEIAQDASPAAEILRTIRGLRKRWLARFDTASKELADYFATAVSDRSDAALRSILKRGGFSVEFHMTRAQNDILQATIGENVALIKSIPEQYLTQVEGYVMRSVTTGRDLGQLAKDLQEQFGVTRRRAALISRDQNNKATAALTRARYLEIGGGEAEAVWIHSGGGKTQRPTHVQAGRDKQRYKISQGWYDPAVKKFIHPGELINCLPGNSIITFAAGCKKLWRHRYAGDLTQIITASGKTIEATPNHPILTKRGWVPIQAVRLGEDIFKVSSEIKHVIDPYVEGNNTSIAEIFDATSFYCRPDIANGRGWFHGDIAYGEIDVIDIDGFLPREINALACKEFLEFLFAESNHLAIWRAFKIERSLNSAFARLFGAPNGIVGGLGSLLSLLKGRSGCTDDVGLGLIADMNTALQKAATDNASVHAIFSSSLKLAHTGLVIGDNEIVREVFGIAGRASVLWNGASPSADVLRQNVSTDANLYGSVFECESFVKKLDSVVDKRSVSYYGHVFNLETFSGYYSANSCITQNCRCVAGLVVKGFS